MVCGFSPGREILSFLEIGACRVGMSFCLCVGLCLVGPLLVGHSFRWRFLIGMGAVLVVRCLSVLHILCLCSWVCHVGLLFWLTTHFGGEICLARGGGACFVVSRTGIQSCGSSVAVIFRGAVPRGVVILVNHSYRRRYLIGTCGVCMAIFHGTSPIPFSFIKLSPPDPNMSTYLDR